MTGWLLVLTQDGLDAMYISLFLLLNTVNSRYIFSLSLKESLKDAQKKADWLGSQHLRKNRMVSPLDFPLAL